MNPYTFPIKGDLSRADVVVLSLEAKKAQRGVLEFGMGGSTVIIACSTRRKFVSCENVKAWVNRTEKNVGLFADYVLSNPEFILTPGPQYEHKLIYEQYDKFNPDLIYIDCEANQRESVTEVLFDRALPGTKFLMHDCHGTYVHKALVNLITRHNDKIKSIQNHYMDSRMVLIEKSYPHPYENWNETEKFNNRCSWDKDDIGQI